MDVTREKIKRFFTEIEDDYSLLCNWFVITFIIIIGIRFLIDLFNFSSKYGFQLDSNYKFVIVSPFYIISILLLSLILYFSFPSEPKLLFRIFKGEFLVVALFLWAIIVISSTYFIYRNIYIAVGLFLIIFPIQKILEYYKIKNKVKKLITTILSIIISSVALVILFNMFNSIYNLNIHFKDFLLPIYNVKNPLSTLIQSILTVLTGILVYIVYIEEFKKPRKIPIEIKHIGNKSDTLEFDVINKTGNRLTGGNKFAILPRIKKIDGNKAILPRFPPNVVFIFLTNFDLDYSFLEDNFQSDNAPMYCETPAVLDKNSWRGFWATYLDPEGGDKIKTLSTDRNKFSVYRNIYNQIILSQIQKIIANNKNQNSQITNEVKNEKKFKYKHATMKAKKLNWWFFNKEILKKQLLKNSQYNKKNNSWENILIDCVFPSFDLEKANSIELELKNIARYKFVKKEGSWILDTEDKIN